MLQGPAIQRQVQTAHTHEGAQRGEAKQMSREYTNEDRMWEFGNGTID